MSLVEISNVTKRFGENTVLDDVSVRIEAGEIITIIGRSGSGKSTLLRCINGLEPVQSGTIMVDGVQVNGPIRGVEAKKDAVSFSQRAPKTCIATVVMEVPDETARDEHLRTVCAAGRAVSEALLAFLRERSAMPETKVTLWRDGATRVRARKRDAAP